MNNNLKSKLGLFLVGTLGAVSMVGQISFIRLSALSFYGNELTMGVVLGHWLLWTGIGSMAGSRLVKRIPVRRTILLISFIYAIVLLLFSYILFIIREIVGIHTSEIVGFGPIFVWTFLILIIPSFTNGLFFPFFVKWVKSFYSKSAVPRVYLAEMFGAAVGSLLFAEFIYLGLNTLQILHLMVALFIISAAVFLVTSKKRLFISLIFSLVVIICLLIFSQPMLLNAKWKPFRVVSFKESPYLSLTTVNYEGVFTLYGDSEPVWTFGEREKAEELVHFGLLSHSYPESILVIGIGNSELIREIERHPSVKNVTIIQPDGILQKDLNAFTVCDSFPCSVRYIIEDPIKILRKIRSKYDVVLLNIPTPVNAQWNRFYTYEFFQLIHRVISPNGIAVLHFPGGENFLTDDHIDFLKTISNTVKLVFKNITWIPGETIHLLASDFPVHNDYASISATLKKRNLKMMYIQDYYLYDRLSPMRIDFLKSQVDQCQTNVVNLITRPVGYYYDTVLWDQRTKGVVSFLYKSLREIRPEYILGVLIAIIAALVVTFWVRGKGRTLIHFSMAAIGFVHMSLEVSLIIIFQSYVGGVYLRIVFLMFAFMIGAGFGAIFQIKGIPGMGFKQLIGLLILITFLPIIVLLSLVFHATPISISWMVPIVLFGSGFIEGIIFPILTMYANKFSASSAVAPSAGRVYAWDVLGSCIGAYFVSGIIIPIWGLYITLIFLLSICFITLFGNLLFRKMLMKR